MTFALKSRMRPALVLLFLLQFALIAVSADAQEVTASPDLSSPRATVTSFLSAMNDVRANQPDRIVDAVACLNLEGITGAERDAAGPERARQLFDILDGQTVFLGDLPESTPNRELKIPLTLLQDSYLQLRLSNENEWRFDSETVKEIPVYHAELMRQKAEAATEIDEEKKVDTRLASPRATMRTFIEGMNRGGNGGEADVTATLDLSSIPDAAQKEQAKRSAELLKEILDRFPLVLYQTIPDAMQIGDEETYTYRLEEDVNLVLHKIRSNNPVEREWKFSPETISELQALYDSVYDRELLVEHDSNRPLSASLRIQNWLNDNYPILRNKVFLVEHWQWIGLFAVIFSGLAASRLFSVALVFVLGRAFRRDNLELDDEAKGRAKDFARPVRLMFMAWMWWIGLGFLSMDPEAYAILKAAAVTITYGGAIWAGWTLIGLIGTYLWARAERTHNKFDDLVVPLVLRTLKVFVVVIGALAIAYEVAEDSFDQVLAGLGLGGLAFALAAKDTIANLFGSVMIIADRPFEIGDWIQVNDIDGSVESVGIRSTRVRTFYNSVVTIPNSELTNAVIDNYGKRKYRRIKQTLGLTYDTTPEMIDAFCEGVRQLIEEHPYTRKDYYHVYLNEFSAYSLDVMLYCFVQTPEWGTELRERHRLFSDILRLADKLGVEFAFPTETEHVRTVATEKAHAEAMEKKSPKSTFDAKRLGRKHAVGIVEDTLGRGMKPPPVDYAAQISDGDDLLDAKKGGMTSDEQDGDSDGN